MVGLIEVFLINRAFVKNCEMGIFLNFKIIRLYVLDYLMYWGVFEVRVDHHHRIDHNRLRVDSVQ